MPAVKQSQRVHWFVIMTAVATLGLIGLGGLVTSHQAGMAVPDWPTTYGYNMFFFPVSQWVGGVFYEHTHRLYAAFIGLLTSIMAGWLWWRGTEGRGRWAGMLTILVLVMALGHRGSGQSSGGASVIPFHFKVLAFVMPGLFVFGIVQCIRHRAAVQWLGLTAFFAVIFQGLLGGLRVALYKDEVGIFHAALAQFFLLLLSATALVTSRWWVDFRGAREVPSRRLLMGSGVACVAIVVQLVLGASMRHQHAGLAVPDFPLAYGKLWPKTDEAAVVSYNLDGRRLDYRDFKPITANHIYLHMAHRVGALLIWLGIITLTIGYIRSLGWKSAFAKAAIVWALLVSLQAVMGALTIWTNKAADVATLHVVLGAVTLIFGALTTLCGFRCRMVSVNVNSLASAKKQVATGAKAPSEAVLAAQ
jgi:heme a synthase